MAKYRWTPGAHVKGSPQQIGEQLDTLQASNGERLTPRVVVDAARPNDSPLHPCFEWDDLRAAEMYREDQARHILRSIRVVVTEGDTALVRRVFVNVVETIDDEEQHGYVPITRVLASDDLRQQLIVQARADLVAIKGRYAEIEELTSLIDPVLDSIDELQLRLPDSVAMGAGEAA